MKPISLTLFCASLFVSGSASAALVDNGSFEIPATGKISDFRDASITGWDGVLASGSADSGVEPGSLTNQDGAYFGFLQPFRDGNDYTMFQFFGDGYTATAGDTIDIDFLGNGAGGEIDLDVMLFWDDPEIAGTVNPIETQNLLIPSNGALTAYNLTYTIAATGDFLDQPIGVALHNGSFAPRWLQVDNVIATATPVPEPATVGLILGSLGLGFAIWRRRSSR